MAPITAQRWRPHLAWWGLALLPLGFIGTFFTWPVLALAWKGLAPDSTLTSGANALTDARTWEALGNTVALALWGTAIAMALGMAAAYALYRLQWRGHRAVRAVLSVPFALPTVVVGIAFTSLLRSTGAFGFLGWDQSMAGIALGLAFFNVSVVMRVVGATWAGLDPSTVTAARTLGASRFRAFRTVTLPALLPSLASAGSLVFLFCASSFGVVLVMGGTRINTVETEIWLQVTQFLDLRAASTLALLQVAVVAASMWVAAVAQARTAHASPVLRTSGSRRATRRDMLPIAAALGLPLALAVAPLATMVHRSLVTAHGLALDHYVALFGTVERSVLAIPVWQATLNSLRFALVAALISTAVGLVVAHLSTHSASRSRFASLGLDGAVMLPLGVSSVIVGLGLLVALPGTPLGRALTDAQLMIPIAQSLVAIPLVVRALVPALRAIDPELLSAARVLGASPWRVWRAVEWPLVRRPVGVALGFAAAISLGEFGATAFLARPDSATLPTAIFRLFGRPGLDNVGMAFAGSVVLATMTAVIMISLERLRRDKEGAW